VNVYDGQKLWRCGVGVKEVQSTYVVWDNVMDAVSGREALNWCHACTWKLVLRYGGTTHHSIDIRFPSRRVFFLKLVISGNKQEERRSYQSCHTPSFLLTSSSSPPPPKTPRSSYPTPTTPATQTFSPS